MKEEVQSKQASNAAIEDAIVVGDEAEKRFKFMSMCVGGDLPFQRRHPSGKHHHSTFSGRMACL
jgi:hypothetical protein